jgi:hypothetical protein
MFDSSNIHYPFALIMLTIKDINMLSLSLGHKYFFNGNLNGNKYRYISIPQYYLAGITADFSKQKKIINRQYEDTIKKVE